MQDTGGTTATAETIGEGPAHRLRALIAETEIRGAPMVSSQALQGRLFEVYDAAAAVPEALALVQRNLGLTLDRTWYSAAEVDALADQIDWLLGRSVSAGPETAEEAAEVVAAASEVPAD